MNNKTRTLILKQLKRIIFASILLTSTCTSNIRPLDGTPNYGTALAHPPEKPKLQGTTSTAVYLPLVRATPNATIIPLSDGWPMVAANPQRTSWTSEEVTGNLHVEWYRPIEAYISQNVQIIADYGMLYVSTAKGLYALDATTGNIVWRYDTELPLGNSPTVFDHVVYVAGYDRRLHAINALNGQPLWDFAGAKAGYDTNPLVVEGKVILGNRDGNMYAIGANHTPQQGQLIWKYQTGGPIHLSAAYKDGVVYFAADDNYAYALSAQNGSLVWKSQQLLGDGFHSYWPVIYQDKVLFSGASSYRTGLNPGTLNAQDAGGTAMEKSSIWNVMIYLQVPQ